MAEQTKHNGTSLRWLAMLVGTAALAMTMVVVLGLLTRGSSQPDAPTMTVERDAPSVVRAPSVSEREAPAVGGPSAPDEAADAPTDDEADPPAVVVAEGRPGTFVWPLGGTFEGGVDPWHPGIDISAPLDTPVGASRGGTVTFVGGDPCCSYGSYVIVQHNEAWASRYAHLGSFAVAEGDTVAQGQLLGRVGLTGRTSGPHLHFELLYYGAPVDPLDHLPGGLSLRSEVLAAGLGASTMPADAADDTSVSEPPSEPPDEAPASPPAAVATPSPTAVMAAAAAYWLAASGEYVVDPATCGGGPAASNQWLVTCVTERTACDAGAACIETKLVCVIEDPLTIWAC